MRVAIVSALLAARHGGPASVVRVHADAINACGSALVFGVSEHEETQEARQAFPDAQLFPRTWPRPWYRGAGLRQALEAMIDQVDVIHAHMLWDHTTWAAWQVARKHGIPLVVTPHGTLNERWRWTLPHKRLYRACIADRILREADKVHVLTQQEQDAIEALGIPIRPVLIPNALPDRFFNEAKPAAGPGKQAGLEGRRYVLYLGRLWGDKGLDLLPEAWASVCQRHPDVDLVIAGPDYKDYRHSLMARIHALGIEHRVYFTGPVYEDDKLALLRSAEFFILPSKSEGLSMALLEASASGLPCIVTPGCKMSALVEAGGGIETERSVPAIAEAIDHLISMSPASRAAMSAAARGWARQHFSLAHIGPQLIDTYRQLTALKKKT